MLPLTSPGQLSGSSLFWPIMGSTFVHLFVVMGLGLSYVGLAPTPPVEHTISINLRAPSDLAQQGAKGMLDRTEPSQNNQPQNNIIRTAKKEAAEQQNNLLLESKELLHKIKQQNQLIQLSERIGFLGVLEAHPAYQEYQAYWQQYVSEFGTKHYPEVLIEKNLDGQLKLDIAIDVQGKVQNIEIQTSSGNLDIDNAAIEIAMLASPYAPLPEAMAKEIDILHIVRTWHFDNHTVVSQALSPIDD